MGNQEHTTKQPSTSEQRRDAAFQRIVERMKREFGYDDQAAIEATRNWLNFAQHLVNMSESIERRENIPAPQISS